MKSFIVSVFLLVGCLNQPGSRPTETIETRSRPVQQVDTQPTVQDAPRVTWTLTTTDEQDNEVAVSPCRLTYLRHLSDSEEVLVECKMAENLVGTLKTQCAYQHDHNTVSAQVFTLMVTLSCWSD